MSNTLNLSTNEQEKLVAKGVDLTRARYLGEGKNRTAYSAYRTTGTKSYPVTICVPKTNPKDQTPNAVINREKLDGDLNEYEVLRNIGVSEADSIEGDGRRINMIPFPSETDLERLVESRGPLRERCQVQHIIGGLLNDLESLSAHGLLHRDIKPDNVFIDYDLREPVGSLGDYQLTGRIDSLKESPLPTRGTGAYAHRSLLNAWATGKPAKASERTDVASFGNTIYFLFTGKKPSSYNLVEAENGREIEFNGRKFKVALVKKDGQGTHRLERLEDKDEELRISQMSKEVPAWAQELVYRCLTDNPRKSFKSFGQVRQYYDKLSEQLYVKETEGPDWKFLAKAGGIAAGVMLGLGTLFGPSKETVKIYEKNPTELHRMMLKPNNAAYAPSKTPLELYQNYIAPRIDKPINGEEAE